MMKLVCMIGTQGLQDGRQVSRGEIYEVDDDTASTLVNARYAKVYVEPVVAATSEVVVEDVSKSEIAQGESHASHFSGDTGDSATTIVPEKKKTKTKRR